MSASQKKFYTVVMSIILLFLLNLNFWGYFSAEENAFTVKQKRAPVSVDLFVMSKCPGIHSSTQPLTNQMLSSVNRYLNK